MFCLRVHKELGLSVTTSNLKNCGGAADDIHWGDRSSQSIDTSVYHSVFQNVYFCFRSSPEWLIRRCTVESVHSSVVKQCFKILKPKEHCC